MGEVDNAFYQEILRHIDAPEEEIMVKACIAWQAAEGGAAAWNPFDTTEPWPGATDYNSVHVKNYASRDDGIMATVATLTNGRYGAVLAAFRAGRSGLAVCNAVDNSAWGTHSAATVYRDRFPDAP